MLIKKFRLKKNKIDRVLLEQYSRINFNDLRSVRRNPIIAKRIFGIDFKSESLQNYYFWDNTTISLKSPLVEFCKSGMKILEIGTGPTATLSRFLANQFKNLSITAVDINKDYLKSGSKYEVCGTNNSISFVESDMTDKVDDKFNVIFMNPPYVSRKDLNTLGISENSAEFKAGFVGENGSSIVEKFLTQIPNLMTFNSVALLGINNKYFHDKKVAELIESSLLVLSKRFYKNNEVPPFSQVYVLIKKH
jgi:methylase of polypeptide subunit release factors